MGRKHFVLPMKMPRRLNSKILFVIIIFVAIVLRFYQLGQNPPSLDWDEASLGYNAYAILKTGADEYGNKFPLSIRSFDDYKPPLYVYLTVPSIGFFGSNEFAVRLPSAILGIIAILTTYFLVKEIFSFKEPLPFLEETPEEVSISRIAT